MQMSGGCQIKEKKNEGNKNGENERVEHLRILKEY